MKKKILIALTIAFTIIMSIPAFAGSFKGSHSPGNGTYTYIYYEYDDGSYPYLEWLWIDDDQDGIAECYYFDLSGYLRRNWTSHDNDKTNENGQWVVNGVVQTKPTSEVQQVDTNDVIQNALQMPTGVYRFYGSFDLDTHKMYSYGERGYQNYDSVYYEIKSNDANGLGMSFYNYLFDYGKDILAKPSMSGAYLSVDTDLSENYQKQYTVYKLDPINKTITVCSSFVKSVDASDNMICVANVYKLSE